MNKKVGTRTDMAGASSPVSRLEDQGLSLDEVVEQIRKGVQSLEEKLEKLQRALEDQGVWLDRVTADVENLLPRVEELERRCEKMALDDVYAEISEQTERLDRLEAALDDVGDAFRRIGRRIETDWTVQNSR